MSKTILGLEKNHFYLLAGLIALFGSFVNFCGTCEGWNLVNPLCHAGVTLCAGQQFIFQWIIRIVGLVLILKGVQD